MDRPKEKWGNAFPTMSALPTSDPRVFQTEWQTVGKKDPMQITKKKTYFACIVSGDAEGDCYGVDVFKGWAVDSTKAQRTALRKMSDTADFRETYGHWPPQDNKEEA